MEEPRRGFPLPQPQAERLLTQEKPLSIGVPRERYLQERRVSLVPASVATLVSRGHQVFVEHRAGEYASFPDRAYIEAGATIVYSPEEVYERAGCIVKITPPHRARATIFAAETDTFFGCTYGLAAAGIPANPLRKKCHSGRVRVFAGKRRESAADAHYE